MAMKSLAALTGLAAGAAVTLIAAPSQAASFSSGGITGEILSYGCPTAVCTDLGSAGYNVVTAGYVFDPAADVNNVALTPGSDDTTAVDSVDDSDKVEAYNITSIKPKPNASAQDFIEVTDLNGKFSFLWGSVDTYNVIEFFQDGIVGAVATFTGSDVAAAAGVAGMHNAVGNFSFDAFLEFTGDFDSVVLSNVLMEAGETGVAFEVAAAVPEPASLLGLAAVGLLGGGSLLKRKQEQEA